MTQGMRPRRCWARGASEATDGSAALSYRDDSCETRRAGWRLGGDGGCHVDDADDADDTDLQYDDDDDDDEVYDDTEEENDAEDTDQKDVQRKIKDAARPGGGVKRIKNVGRETDSVAGQRADGKRKGKGARLMKQRKEKSMLDKWGRGCHVIRLAIAPGRVTLPDDIGSMMKEREDSY
ncbi:hypothetical protein PoB_004459700 [Plakobranchus ocellatus]|uniref:Uncharacterized protein n=1 Tax=Plakobranchus ocellatus TaxID=259542 RepID=A0AAV4BGJ9_9GAST|nr:hypothetical protein PoB_004459700 [Plakobranchus ocellatus]